MPQTEAQKKAAFTAAGLNPGQQAAANAGVSIASPISVANLQEPIKPFNIQQPQAPVLPTVPTPPAETTEDQQDPLGNLETSIAGMLGDKDQALEAETLKQTAASKAQLSQLDARIAGFDAAALKRQETALNSGDTLAFSTGLAGNVARTDAIERLTLIAQKQAIQGDISSAERTAKIAVDAEFAAQQQRLETLRQNIVNNYDDFSADQKKRADALLLKLDKDDAFVAGQKATRLAIANVATLVAKNGFGDIAGKVRMAKTEEEAFALAAQYMQDPKDALALEVMRIDKKLKQWELDHKGQPTEEDIEKAQVKQDKVKAASDRANKVLALVRAMKENSLAKQSAIGIRGPGAILGRPGVDDYLNKTKSLQGLLALDQLKDLKGTGAVSDREFGTAAAAATTIILDEENGKIKGSPAALDAELTRIETAMVAALTELNSLDPDEEAMIDAAVGMPAIQTNFNPMSYFVSGSTSPF
jgi:hypothetical protein